MAGLENLTITALRDELDLMREVTRMLNKAGNKGIKTFKDLAKAVSYTHLTLPTNREV